MKMLDDGEVSNCYDDGFPVPPLERVQLLLDTVAQQQATIDKLEEEERDYTQKAYDANMLIVEALNEAGAPRFAMPSRKHNDRLSTVQRIRALGLRIKS